jgi:hypothetical protein
MRGYGAGFRYYRQSERKMTEFSGTVQNREVRKVAGERSYWILDFYRRRSDRLMSLNLQKIVAVETDGIRMKKRSEQELKFMLGIGRSLAEPVSFRIDVQADRRCFRCTVQKRSDIALPEPVSAD